MSTVGLVDRPEIGDAYACSSSGQRHHAYAPSIPEMHTSTTVLICVQPMLRDGSFPFYMIHTETSREGRNPSGKRGPIWSQRSRLFPVSGHVHASLLRCIIVSILR